ncbi:MAG: hypothetical protein WDW38_010138 [Sanguina aurantia]
MVSPGSKPGDYDLFIIVPSEGRTPAERTTEAKKLIMRVMQQMLEDGKSIWGHLRSACALFCPKVIDFTLLRGNNEEVFKAQMVLRLYESPAQVLHGFDLDACQLLFDGGEVWATRDALRAWHTQAMLVQPLRQQPQGDAAAALLRELSDGIVRVLGVLLPQPEVHAIETAASLMLLFEGLAEDCPALGFAAKEDGLARLLALGHLAEQDVSGQMDEAATMLQLEALCMQAASRGITVEQFLEGVAKMFPSLLRWSLEKTANKRSWHLGPDEQDYSSGSEDAPWVNVTKEVLAQAHESLPPLSATDKELADCMEGLVLETKGVHLRAGQAVDQPSGSFQAEPVEEWYRGPIKKLEEMTRSVKFDG